MNWRLGQLGVLAFQLQGARPGMPKPGDGPRSAGGLSGAVQLGLPINFNVALVKYGIRQRINSR
jgi:hypothetical protein